MQERKFDRKNRNTAKRKQRPVILIVAEGENVTESQYFRHFLKPNSEYTIRMVAAKHVTDPGGMLETIQKKWHELDLDERKGDAAFIVVDLDCSDEKAKAIKALKQNSKGIQFIVSNPCFEVWFLLHFRYSTRSFINNNAVIRELKDYEPAYEKNMDIFSVIGDKTELALDRTIQLQKYYEDLGYDWPSNNCNPFTDVPIIIKKIKGLGV